LTGLLITAERQRETEGNERQKEVQSKTKCMEITKEMTEPEESKVKSTRQKKVGKNGNLFR
jgi:hypothetical protein